MKRQKLENALQAEIEAAIGAESDLLLLKNSVGKSRFTSADGKVFVVPYGLGVGSPDLVGVLAPFGAWFCLEVKRPGEKPTPEQLHCHAVWRQFGAYVEVVTSAEEAKAALRDARGLVRNTRALLQTCTELGHDEHRVITYLAERLLEGQRRYGRLDLATDRRDWQREQAEEAADLLIYAAFDALKKGVAA